jgi:hypothetical protein
MQNVTMWKVSPAILGLKVPGLAERRPSVIYRDKIYVRRSGTTAREFQVSILSTYIYIFLCKWIDIDAEPC